MRPTASLRALLAAAALLLATVALGAPTGMTTSQAKTAAPVPVDLGATTNVEGTSTAFAKADHQHAVTWSAAALGTCDSSRERVEVRMLGTGGTGTGYRTRLCRCTSDGASTPVFAWANTFTGEIGTSTTCPDATYVSTAYALDMTFPILPEDRGTVADHIYWSGSAIVSTKGTAFTMNGTVPQTTNAQLGGRGAAGPFAAGNSYKTTALSDPWDFTTNGFAFFAYTMNTATSGRMFSGFSAASNGWNLLSTGNGINYAPYSSGGGNLLPTTTPNYGMVTGSVATACAGQVGSEGLMNLTGEAQRKVLATGALTPSTTTSNFFGVSYDGTSNPMDGYLIEALAISSPTSTQNLDALCTYYTRRFTTPAGMQSLRATKGTYRIGATRYTSNPGAPRAGANGYVIESPTVNYFATPLVPATQTMTLPIGSYCSWLEGTGTNALAVGTATATGLPCTTSATATGCGCSFTVTVAGTVTATVAGSVTAANVTLGTGRLELVTLAGTYPGNASSGDLIRVPNSGNGSSRGAGSVDVYPSWGSGSAGVDRPVIVDTPMGVPVGTTPNFSVEYVSASATWRVRAGGATASSSPQIFAAGTKTSLGWSYTVGGPVCVVVNGTSTCAGTVAAFTPGTFLTLGSYGAAANVPVTFLGMAAVIDSGFNGSIKNLQLGPTSGAGSVRTAIAAIGDSLTYGKTASVTTPYPLALQNLLGSGYFVDNHGISGQWAYPDQLSGSIHPRYWRDVQGYPYAAVVVMIGTNDLFGSRTAAQTTPWIQSIYDSVRADGKVLVPVTIPPSSTFTAGQKTERTAINTWILNYCTANGIACADAGSDLNDGADNLKGIYNSGDNLHLNDAGYARLAVLVEAALP